MHTFNKRMSQHMREKLTEMQGEIDKSTIWLWTFNTLLLVTYRPSSQKISENMVGLDSAINQLD